MYSIAIVEVNQSEQQHQQQHSSSTVAAAQRQQLRWSIRLRRVSLSRSIRELRTYVPQSVIACPQENFLKMCTAVQS